jgi:hypothetical protein
MKDPLFQVMDKVLAHFAGSHFADEVKKAKQEFFDNAGILEETSAQFELRMNQFFDWYFFTRPLLGYGQAVLNVTDSARELRFDENEKQLLSQLQAFRHGLFEFIKLKDRDVTIRDLLRNEKLVVRQSPYIFGFDSEEVFEARLIPQGDTHVFCRGFCFHPREARSFILNQIKRHRKNPDLNPADLMLRLLKMRYKLERYRHVDIHQIYSDSNRVGL